MVCPLDSNSFDGVGGDIHRTRLARDTLAPLPPRRRSLNDRRSQVFMLAIRKARGRETRRLQSRRTGNAAGESQEGWHTVVSVMVLVDLAERIGLQS